MGWTFSSMCSLIGAMFIFPMPMNLSLNKSLADVRVSFTVAITEYISGTVMRPCSVQDL